MAQSRVGPNEPCPCGSRKKYKRCCQGAEATPSTESAPAPSAALPGGRFRFEPGSYGGHGRFAAAISCHKQVRPGEWVYHFVLANSGFTFEKEQEAVAAAEEHLEGAGGEKVRTGSDAAFARYLSDLGYLSVDRFKVIEEP